MTLINQFVRTFPLKRCARVCITASMGVWIFGGACSPTAKDAIANVLMGAMTTCIVIGTYGCLFLRTPHPPPPAGEREKK